MSVSVTTEKLPCRLIAYRAPKEVADKRRREINKAAKKKGRTPKQETLSRLDFTFFITNITAEVWKSEVVGTVYTIRWQIELIYKNWKTLLHINYLKGTNANRIQCLLYGKLIMIVVINMIYKLADWYAQQLEREISQYKVVRWLKQESKIAKNILSGLSIKSMKQIELEITKTLCKGKRKRKTTHACLEQGIAYMDLYTKKLQLQTVRVA